MSTSSKLHSLSHILIESDGPLQPIMAQVKQQQQYTRVVHQLLPASLHDQVMVVNVVEGVLTLGVYSSAVAARVRVQTTELLTALRQEPGWQGLASITLQLLPMPPTRSIPEPQAREPLSAALKRDLEAQISSTEDDALRTSMITFLKHHG